MDPDGHVTILRSNSKELLSGQEKFGGGKSTLLSTHGMYLREQNEKESAGGWIFLLWTELLGVVSVSLVNSKDEMARHKLEVFL